MPITTNLHKFLFIAGVSIALGGCGSSSNDTPTPIPTPPPQEIDYQLVLNNAVNAGIPGVALYIDGQTKQFSGSAGVSDLETLAPMQTYDLMPTGSAGKKATALLAAMLHNEGLLNIDDTIDTWLPESLLNQIQYSESMTLRQLLNHTAGIFDYLDDSVSGMWFESIMSDPLSLKTDEYALQFALNKPAYFEPGESFRYSNTGYLLAGLIMDQVLGEHHSVAMRNRIFVPLGMNNTYYNGVEKELGTIISGYLEIDGELLNSKPAYENIGVADAPLVSTVEDMSVLLKSIITDYSVIDDDIRELLLGEESMVQTSNAAQYGLGLFKEQGNGQTLYYHAGEDPGYHTENLYFAESDTSVTLFVNCTNFEPCTSQTAGLIQTVVNSLIE